MPPGTWLTSKIRQQMNDYLIDTCTIKGMNASRAYVTLASNVKCRKDRPSASDSNSASEMDTVTTFYVLTVPYDTTLALGNQIVLADGSYWDVFKVFDEGTPLVQKRAYIRQSDQRA